MITEERPSPKAKPRRARPEYGPGRDAAPDRLLILFGAFDRHNFGDLLLAHCASALRPGRRKVFAGLGARDLTAYGGHRVRALAEVVAEHADEPADLVHVGGEILTTTSWEAAVMLQSRAQAARAIAAFERDAATRRSWAARALGTAREMPYVVAADTLPERWRVHFDPVGGVDFARLAPLARDEVLHALSGADEVRVRDGATQTALARAGFAASLAPDPAAATARLLGSRIAARARSTAFTELEARMPRRIAVQLAADWADDATLGRVAAALARDARRSGSGIVLFCAGLAPWHDDPDLLARLQARLGAGTARPAVERFASADVFDLCALLATAHAYVGTSLHGWIVAASFGVPAHCLVRTGGDKAAAYLDSWHPAPRAWRTLDDPDLVPAGREAPSE